MKRDARTGRHVIIEPNVGRPTGRSAIAEAGGVELLYTMYCDCIGAALPADRVQRHDEVKWIFWRRDLQSAFHYWRNGELTLWDWWKSWSGRKAYAVFSWTDPGPFWSDIKKALHLAVYRMLHRKDAGSIAHTGPASHPPRTSLCHRLHYSSQLDADLTH